VEQLAKGWELAMHSAALLSKENTELRAENQGRRQKQQQRRRYITQGGVLLG
ncbi:hypothetical protein CC78DRAFT_481245, partial [Lojkania enalia]